MNKAFYAAAFLCFFLSMNCSEKSCSSQASVEKQQNIMDHVDSTRYAEDLELVAVERTLRSAGHEIVKNLCAQRLIDLGFDVEFDSYGTGVNVIGRINGTDKPDEAVILSAHYDSRNAGCPGADDNASGVAGVLEAARILAKSRYSRTLIVAFWDEEEKGLKTRRGLVGSRAYAAKAKREGMNIVLAVVFEMIGYRSSEPGTQRFPTGWKTYFPAEMQKVAENENRGDFICLTVKENEKKYSDAYKCYSDELALPSLVLSITRKTINIHDFRRSDHAAFWENDYPALLISDTTNYRNRNYHCHSGRKDDISKIDIVFACNTVRAAIATVEEILNCKI